MRLICTNKPPRQSLGAFFQTHWPGYGGTYVKERSSGYGYWHEIRLPLARILHLKVAHIYHTLIELHHPQYLSYVEDIARSYESMGGEEVTIQYSEEP